MRRLSANYVFPLTQPPIRNGIVETDNDGLVVSVVDPKGDFRETSKLEFYNGVLVPGFTSGQDPRRLAGDQVRSLARRYPGLTFHELLQWISSDGAGVFPPGDRPGSIEPGSSVEIILIQPFDFSSMQLDPRSKAFKLV
jgi:hypothetical protein